MNDLIKAEISRITAEEANPEDKTARFVQYNVENRIVTYTGESFLLRYLHQPTGNCQMFSIGGFDGMVRLFDKILKDINNKSSTTKVDEELMIVMFFRKVFARMFIYKPLMTVDIDPELLPIVKRLFVIKTEIKYKLKSSNRIILLIGFSFFNKY